MSKEKECNYGVIKKISEGIIWLWRAFLWLFMFADIFVFFSGILVSYTINILTTHDISNHQKLATILWLIASFLLVVLTMIVKPNQDEYKKHGGSGLLHWEEVLKPRTKIFLIIIFLITMALIIVGALIYTGII